MLTTEIVNYMITSNGPSDFHASGFVVINANEASTVFLIIPLGDDIPELQEEFNITIYKVSFNVSNAVNSVSTSVSNAFPKTCFSPLKLWNLGMIDIDLMA